MHLDSSYEDKHEYDEKENEKEPYYDDGRPRPVIIQQAGYKDSSSSDDYKISINLWKDSSSDSYDDYHHKYHRHHHH